MENAWQNDPAIPLKTRNGLMELCAGLKSNLGDTLVSLILYGELAHDDDSPEHAVAHVMFVLKQVDVRTLDKVAPSIQKGIRKFNLAPFLLTEDDLKRSTDVFPIKFLDMQHHHRLLDGSDVLKDLSISKDHLRLRCEQEVKNLSLRLHNFYVREAPKPKRLRETLERVIVPFVLDLRTLLFITEGDAPSKRADVADAAAKAFDLDGRTLNNVVALLNDDHQIDSVQLKQLYGKFMDIVHELAEMIDGL